MTDTTVVTPPSRLAWVKSVGGYAILAVVVLLVAFVAHRRHSDNRPAPVIERPVEAPVKKRVQPKPKAPASPVTKPAPAKKPAPKKDPRKETYTVCYANGICYRQVCGEHLCWWIWY